MVYVLSRRYLYSLLYSRISMFHSTKLWKRIHACKPWQSRRGSIRKICVSWAQCNFLSMDNDDPSSWRSFNKCCNGVFVEVWDHYISCTISIRKSFCYFISIQFCKYSQQEAPLYLYLSHQVNELLNLQQETGLTLILLSFPHTFRMLLIRLYQWLHKGLFILEAATLLPGLNLQ